MGYRVRVTIRVRVSVEQNYINRGVHTVRIWV